MFPPEDKNEPVNFRYDVQCMISNESLSRKDINPIRQRITDECIGDCLLVIGMKGKIKVHFHTDTPDCLFKILEDYGKFDFKAVEDMKEQYEMFKAKKENENDKDDEAK